MRQMGAGSRHTESPTPTKLDQNLVERQQAMIQCDAGIMRNAADLVGAAFRENGWIDGILDIIAKGIPGLPHEFVGPPALVRALKGVSIAEWREASKRGLILEPRRGMFGDLFPDAEKSKMLKWALPLGVCPVQRLRLPPSGDFGAPRATFTMRVWNPRNLRYDHAQGRWALWTWGQEIWIDEHSDEFCLFRPYGDMKPWETAPWESLVKCYLMARDAEFDRTRHSAMNGPVWWIQGGPETTPQNLEDAKTVLATMERRGRMVLQNGESLHVDAPTAGDMGSIYRDIISDCKSEVAICYLGSDVLIGKTSTGLGDNKEVFERMTARKIDFIASALERFEQQEVLDHWTPTVEPGARVGILYDTRPPSEREAPGKEGSAPTEKKPSSNVVPLKDRPADAKDQDIQVEPEQVLNGAQIAAAIDIVVQVHNGTLPRDAGIHLLETSFNLTPQKAIEIMGSAGLQPSPKVAA